jgi:hypothetical protein
MPEIFPASLLVFSRAWYLLGLITTPLIRTVRGVVVRICFELYEIPLVLSDGEMRIVVVGDS